MHVAAVVETFLELGDQISPDQIDLDDLRARLAAEWGVPLEALSFDDALRPSGGRRRPRASRRSLAASAPGREGDDPPHSGPAGSLAAADGARRRLVGIRVIVVSDEATWATPLI